MKQLKTIKRLTAFGLLVLMTACSTENTVIGNVGVSDVKSSGCKASVSQLDSRPEYYKVGSINSYINVGLSPQ